MPRFPLTALLVLLVGCSPAAGPEPPPDVVVVTIDTLRADHLGGYGYPRETSPNLDALAASGVRFEACRAPMATTLPSHLSLFTGTHPLRHGVLANRVGDSIYERDPGLITLAEELREAGYTTGAFVSAFVLRRDAGLAAGFDRYDEPAGAERPGHRTLERALSWWSEAGPGPRFLWVHLFEPHGPYEPPDHLASLFAGDRIAGPVLRDRHISDAMNQRLLLNDYDREVRHADELVGQLLDEVGEEVVLLIVADHGEGLWQHGWKGHGFLWEEQLRVPAILRAPGLEPRVESRPHSISDLAPLLLDLLPAVEGGSVRRQSSRTREILGQGHLALAAVKDPEAPPLLRTAWTEGRWSLMRIEERSGEGVRRSLFDLSRDGIQVRDLAERETDHTARLEESMLEAASTLIEERGGRRRDATELELRQLEALGYGGSADD